MKKILIISYYYPPYRGIGGQRAYFLSKFLSENGYIVKILKTEDNNYKDQISKRLINKENNVETISIDAGSSFFDRYFLNFFKYRKNIKEIISKENFSLLIFTGEPFYYFPVGRYIYNKYQIPYILDYRDNLFKTPKSLLDFFYRLFFKYLWDKPAIKKASYIINVSEQPTILHRAENPAIPSNRFLTIFNGYNDKLTLTTEKDKNLENTEDDILKVGIFGKFLYYSNQDANTLIDSLELLDFKIKIYVIGKVEKDFLKLVEQRKVSKHFEFLGYMDYEKGMKTLKRMDCFLLNVRAKYHVGTKIFDYIYLNNPIIAFTPPRGEVASLLDQFENAFTVIGRDKKKLANIFTKIFSMQKKVLDKKTINLQRYSRSYQFTKLLKKIDKITDNSNSNDNI
jgi:glycosyltransferase involved in cell wall biosynthesis